jgi:hypothetical protein
VQYISNGFQLLVYIHIFLCVLLYKFLCQNCNVKSEYSTVGTVQVLWSYSVSEPDLGRAIVIGTSSLDDQSGDPQGIKEHRAGQLVPTEDPPEIWLQHCTNLCIQIELYTYVYAMEYRTIAMY